MQVTVNGILVYLYGIAEIRTLDPYGMRVLLSLTPNDVVESDKLVLIFNNVTNIQYNSDEGSLCLKSFFLRAEDKFYTSLIASIMVEHADEHYHTFQS